MKLLTAVFRHLQCNKCKGVDKNLLEFFLLTAYKSQVNTLPFQLELAFIYNLLVMFNHKVHFNLVIQCVTWIPEVLSLIPSCGIFIFFLPELFACTFYSIFYHSGNL